MNINRKYQIFFGVPKNDILDVLVNGVTADSMDLYDANSSACIMFAQRNTQHWYLANP